MASGRISFRVSAGIAATLCTMEFLLWGGAFVAADHPYAPPQIFVWFTTPYVIAIGLSLLCAGRLFPRFLKGLFVARIVALLCQVMAVLALSALLSLPDTYVLPLATVALAGGVGNGAALLAWQGDLSGLDAEKIPLTVCVALVAFPIASIALALLPVASYNALAGVLACASSLLLSPRPIDAGVGDSAERSLVDIVRGEGVAAACVCSIAAVVGVTRTVAIGAASDSRVVTFGSLIGVFVAGVAVLAALRIGKGVSGPQSVYKVVFASSGVALVAAFIAGGSPELFSCCAQLLFQVVVIAAMLRFAMDRPNAASTAAYAVVMGLAYLSIGVGNLAGMGLNAISPGGISTFSIAAALCAYILAVPLLLIRHKGRTAAVADASHLEEAESRRVRQISEELGLSPREEDVLLLTLRGLESPEIAERLRLSDNTVRTHRKSLYRKLNVHSRSEVFALVRGEGKAEKG